MALFEWTPAFSVRIPQFDEDHQRLFGIINGLNDAMEKGHGRDVIAGVVAELERYTHEHFSREEAALRKAGFCELSEHIAEHRFFVSKVREFEAGLHSDLAVVPHDALFFLGDWLRLHIMHSDRRYIELLTGGLPH